MYYYHYYLSSHPHSFFLIFFFNDPATTEIYTLSLHDALPILGFTLPGMMEEPGSFSGSEGSWMPQRGPEPIQRRLEEHTSELQSPVHLVCRLLLEKKKKYTTYNHVLQRVIPITY